MRYSDSLRRRELECLRLAADCMQLAGAVRSSVLQAHFIRMARLWPILARQGPTANVQTIQAKQASR